jgi:hypothetical protein
VLYELHMNPIGDEKYELEFYSASMFLNTRS